MAVIACVDVDPFLVSLVRRLRPEDDVRELTAGAAIGSLPRSAVVVTPVAGAELVVDPRLAARTLLIAEPDGPPVPQNHAGAVLRRPIDVTELRLELAQLLPRERLARIRGRVAEVGEGTSPGGVFAIARFGALTAAAALDLTSPMGPPLWGLVVVLFVWALVRVWARDRSALLVGVDAVLVIGAMLLTGGTDSPYVLLGAVTAAEIGYAWPSAIGSATIGALTIAGLVPLTLGLRDGSRDPIDLVSWALLLTLASLAGVFADRLRRTDDRSDLDRLEALHATLDRLSRQAQGVAGGLELSGVVNQALATMRDDLGAVAGAVLLGDDGVRTVAGSFGLTDAPPARVLAADDAQSIAPDLGRVLPPGDHVRRPIRRNGVEQGSVVVVLASGEGTAEAQREVARLAAVAAVAIDNARIFDQVRQLTIDDERRRLARDLHDGVIQSLVHVGFELDLVSRDLDDGPAGEVRRLREVVGETVAEVRSTVNDLRSVRLQAGLGTALVALAKEYRRDGLTIDVDAGPVHGLTPEGELQLLRIAQEAVSNAVHHGRASAIVVRLWENEAGVHLQVLDDGHGFDAGMVTTDPTRGVGLRAMQERADLLGAHLDLGPGADGGTCVQVDVPVRSRAT